MTEWLTVVGPFATAIVAAYLSARWTTARAYEQRWWERKERAYSEIVEALYDVIAYFDLTAEDYLTSKEEENPKMAAFRARYSEAYLKIQRLTDIGAFVISDKVAEVLMDLRKRPRLKWDENPPWEVYEEESRHFREALSAIKRLAKQDLKI
jgi:hypothetical protein